MTPPPVPPAVRRRVAAAGRRLAALAEGTLADFTGCGGTRLAAAVAYYALLSLFPLVIVLVAVASLVVPEATMRDQVIDGIVDVLPLTAEGDRSVRAALEGAAAGAGAVGVVGLVALLWSASGMVGATRAGLNAVTDAESARPFLQGKLVDTAAVLLSGSVLLVSAALTVATRLTDAAVLEPLGLPAAGPLLGVLTPILLTALVVAAVLRFLPATPIPWCGVWRGAVGGAAALWALATGFGFYVGNFGRYNAIYGSLGTVAALMVFVWLAAIVLLVTSAAAARWPAIAASDATPGDGDGEPLGRRLRTALAGLLVRR